MNEQRNRNPKHPRREQMLPFTFPFGTDPFAVVFSHPTITVPVDQTIVQSASPVLVEHPGHVLTTFVKAPDVFPPDHPYGPSLWHITLNVSTEAEQEPHYRRLVNIIVPRVARYRRYLQSVEDEIRHWLWWLARGDPEHALAATLTLRETLEYCVGGRPAKLPEIVRQRLEGERRLQSVVPLDRKGRPRFALEPWEERVPSRDEASSDIILGKFRVPADQENYVDGQRILERVHRELPPNDLFRIVVEKRMQDFSITDAKAGAEAETSIPTIWRRRQDLKKKFAR